MEDELDTTGLSAAELAALQDEDDSEVAEALLEVAGIDEDEEVDGDEEDDETDDTDDGDVTADDASKADQSAQTDEEEPAAVAEFAPMQVVNAVENFDEKIEAFKTEKADLRTKLNNGEIDLDAYEAEKEKISEQELTLRLQQSNAESAARQNEHIAKERWNWEQERFFNDPNNAIYKNKIIHAAMNATVIDLANDPKNAQRDGAWFLREADRQVRESFGQSAPAKTNTKANGGKRAPDLSNVPKTLGNLPAAEIEDTGGDEFAHLDKLSGIPLEQALAKMSQDQVDRYLSAR